MTEIKESMDYDLFVENPQREQYIISQALYFGIKHIQAQPERFREYNNMWDMADLFNKKYPHFTSTAKYEDPEFDEVMKSARRPADLRRIK